MQSFFKFGLIVGLGLSSLSFVGCSDDSDEPERTDSGTPARPDSGAGVIDSGVPGLDASVNLDAGKDSGVSNVRDAAEGIVYDVTLSSAQEVPVCASAGSAATGAAKVTLSPDEDTITVQIAYSGLSGDVKAGHIHSGAAGASGPVVLPFSGSLASPIRITLSGSSYVAAEGAPPTYAAFLTALKAGNSYLNLHTAACGGGEIRAQIK